MEDVVEKAREAVMTTEKGTIIARTRRSRLLWSSSLTSESSSVESLSRLLWSSSLTSESSVESLLSDPVARGAFRLMVAPRGGAFGLLRAPCAPAFASYRRAEMESQDRGSKRTRKLSNIE